MSDAANFIDAPARRRGRPPTGARQSDRNRRYRKNKGLVPLSVHVPAAVAAQFRQFRQSRGITAEGLIRQCLAALEDADRLRAEELARAERERQAAEREWAEAANKALAARTYTQAEDERLIELGGRLTDWNEIHRLMGRSSPQALKARFAKIEPLANKAARTGKEIRFRPDASRRPCLQCKRPFDSAGHHNRLCDPCRTAEGYSQDEW